MTACKECKHCCWLGSRNCLAVCLVPYGTQSLWKQQSYCGIEWILVQCHVQL